MEDASGEFAEIFALSCPEPYLPDTVGTGCWTEGNPFSGVQVQSPYWSAVSHADSPDRAYLVGLMGTGIVIAINKLNLVEVWPVKDGP
jgi:hypothetical protein